MRLLSATVFAALMLPSLAIADPTGSFKVRGQNPDTGQQYIGKVRITRTGELYKVVWTIAGDETVGVGIGIQSIQGAMVAGPANTNDVGIAVSYTSGETPGNATYTELADGTWQGVWAYSGYKQLATEEWIPTKLKIAAKSLMPVEKPVVQTETDKVQVSDEPTQSRSAPRPAPSSPKL